VARLTRRYTFKLSYYAPPSLFDVRPKLRAANQISQAQIPNSRTYLFREWVSLL